MFFNKNIFILALSTVVFPVISTDVCAPEMAICTQQSPADCETMKAERLLCSMPPALQNLLRVMRITNLPQLESIASAVNVINTAPVKAMINHPKMHDVIDDISFIFNTACIRGGVANYVQILDQLLAQNPGDAKLLQLRAQTVNQPLYTAISSFLVLTMLRQAFAQSTDFAGLHASITNLVQEKFLLCKQLAAQDELLVGIDAESHLKALQDLVVDFCEKRTFDPAKAAAACQAGWRLIGATDELIQAHTNAIASYQGDLQLVYSFSIAEDILKYEDVMTHAIITLFGNGIAGESIYDVVMSGLQTAASNPEIANIGFSCKIAMRPPAQAPADATTASAEQV